MKFLLRQHLLSLLAKMINKFKHIILRIRSVVTLLILAGQTLTFINQVCVNNFLQNQSRTESSFVFSSDLLLNETINRDKPSRLKNVLCIYQDKLVQTVGHNTKFAAFLDYYLKYKSTTKQQYPLLISQNHSLRSPPAFS